MSFLLNFPKYYLCEFLSNWISLKNINVLDCSFCNTNQRNELLFLLQCDEFYFPIQNKLNHDCMMRRGYKTSTLQNKENKQMVVKINPWTHKRGIKCDHLLIQHKFFTTKHDFTVSPIIALTKNIKLKSLYLLSDDIPNFINCGNHLLDNLNIISINTNSFSLELKTMLRNCSLLTVISICCNVGTNHCLAHWRNLFESNFFLKKLHIKCCVDGNFLLQLIANSCTNIEELLLDLRFDEPFNEIYLVELMSSFTKLSNILVRFNGDINRNTNTRRRFFHYQRGFLYAYEYRNEPLFQDIRLWDFKKAQVSSTTHTLCFIKLYGFQNLIAILQASAQSSILKINYVDLYSNVSSYGQYLDTLTAADDNNSDSDNDSSLNTQTKHTRTQTLQREILSLFPDARVFMDNHCCDHIS